MMLLIGTTCSTYQRVETAIYDICNCALMLQEDFQLSKLQLRQDCEECEALAFLVCYGKYMQTFATLNMETINHHIVYFSQNVN